MATKCFYFTSLDLHFYFENEFASLNIAPYGGDSRWKVHPQNNQNIEQREKENVYTNTLAIASAPALAMNGFDGWNATSRMLSSNFFRCAVIS